MKTPGFRLGHKGPLKLLVDRRTSCMLLRAASSAARSSMLFTALTLVHGRVRGVDLRGGARGSCSEYAVTLMMYRSTSSFPLQGCMWVRMDQGVHTPGVDR